MTLLEMALTAALVGLVGISFMAVYGTAQRYLIQTFSMSSSQGEAGYVLAHMRSHMLPGNRLLVLGADRLAFRHDPSTKLDAQTAAIDNDQWDGYRLLDNGTTPPSFTLRYEINLGVAGNDDPADVGAGASFEIVARHVLSLTFTNTDGTAVPQPPPAGANAVPQVLIDLSVQQPGPAGGQNPGPAHVVTVVSPRGVGSA